VSGSSDFQAIEEAKKLLNTGNFEGGTNPVIYANQRQTICVSLVSDIDLDESTNSCPLNVGHVSRVEDPIMRPVLAHFGLEFNQRG
jgi:hypothetical protein